MHRILRTRRMFQAGIPSEENQEARRPILRATMARRHQFRDYGWQYTAENLAVSLREIQRGANSSQIPRNYRRKRAQQIHHLLLFFLF